MIAAVFKLLWRALKIGIVIAAVLATLCVNVFTLPLFAVCYVVCSITQRPKPVFATWVLTVYPTWKKPDVDIKQQLISFSKGLFVFLLWVLSVVLLIVKQWGWGIGLILMSIFVTTWLYPDTGETHSSLSRTLKPITGYDFEYFCADLLKNKGFRQVYVTKASGDYGADITAVDGNGEIWVFQCKYYKSNVPMKAVQEVVSAKAHYNAKRAAVMTNSRMTEQARQLAFENAVELYEGLCD